jgi:hypothetical protein
MGAGNPCRLGVGFLHIWVRVQISYPSQTCTSSTGFHRFAGTSNLMTFHLPSCIYSKSVLFSNMVAHKASSGVPADSVNGKERRHSSNVDPSNPQGISAFQISPALSDTLPSLEPSLSFKIALDLTFGMLALDLQSTRVHGMYQICM